MKNRTSSFTALALLLGAPIASAQGVDEFGPYGYDDDTLESPQNAALELRFGPYHPGIDEQIDGSAFQTHFGDDSRWLIGFEYDWQLLEIPSFGTLGPGFGMGYTKMSGAVIDGQGDATGPTTTLSILPMYVVAVLRADVISKATPVPLVPYAKAGIGYALWWTDDGSGQLERTPDGVQGSDTSWGTQFALGVMLLLDVFEPRAAANMDSTSGINSSYVFLEWYNSDLSGFGSDEHMQVGSNTWMTGIALEM